MNHARLFTEFAIIAALFTVTISSAPAHAEVLIEPFLGYEFGTIKGSNSDNISGPGYGARLGYTSAGFMFGGEYALGNFTEKTSSGNKTDKTTDIGAFVGYNFPVMFRVYGTYFIDSTLTQDGQSSDFTGHGYRLGLGYTGFPLITLAVEILQRTYTKQGSTSLSPDVVDSTTAITVTLPLSF